MYYDQYMSDGNVSTMLEVMTPLALIMYKRLTLVIRVSSRTNPKLWVLLAWGAQAKRSWISAVGWDVEWLRANCEFCANVHSMQDLVTLAQVSSTKLRGSIYDAIKKCPMFPPP